MSDIWKGDLTEPMNGSRSFMSIFLDFQVKIYAIEDVEMLKKRG